MRELTRYFVTKPKQPRVKKKRGENGTKKVPTGAIRPIIHKRSLRKSLRKKKKLKNIKSKEENKIVFLFPCAVAPCAASLFCLACCRRRSLLCVTS